MQLPQCPICLVLLTQELELVRPDNCGHVMCRNCAVLLAKESPRCPFCSSSARLKELKQVVLSYGECDFSTSIEPDMTSLASDDTVFEDDVRWPMVDLNSIVVRGEHTLRLLDDVGNSDPLEWRLPSSGGGHDRGLVFVRTGRLINEIGASIEEGNGVKALLMRFGETITNLQNCYRKTVDLANLYKSVKRENDILKEKMSEQEIKQMAALQEKDMELARKEREFSIREKEEMEKRNKMRKALEATRLERDIAKDKAQEMEQTLQKVVRKIKKLETLHVKNSQVHDTDSSLEIMDEEESLPPSSSLTSMSSESRPKCKKLSSKDPVGSSSTTLPSKPRSKAYVPSSSAPLPNSLAMNSTSQPSSSVLPELESDSAIPEGQDLAMLDFTDALLKAEAQPRAKPESRSSKHARPRPPLSSGSANGRSLASSGIPTNPLATIGRANDASWREKKKPRMQLG